MEIGIRNDNMAFKGRFYGVLETAKGIKTYPRNSVVLSYVGNYPLLDRIVKAANNPKALQGMSLSPQKYNEKSIAVIEMTYDAYKKSFSGILGRLCKPIQEAYYKSAMPGNFDRIINHPKLKKLRISLHSSEMALPIECDQTTGLYKKRYIDHFLACFQKKKQQPVLKETFLKLCKSDKTKEKWVESFFKEANDFAEA